MSKNTSKPFAGSALPERSRTLKVPLPLGKHTIFRNLVGRFLRIITCNQPRARSAAGRSRNANAASALVEVPPRVVLV